MVSDIGEHATVPDKSLPVRDHLSDKKQQPSHHSCCQSTQATRLLERKNCAGPSYGERRVVAHRRYCSRLTLDGDASPCLILMGGSWRSSNGNLKFWAIIMVSKITRMASKITFMIETPRSRLSERSLDEQSLKEALLRFKPQGSA
jgi:hypothetical protein